MNLEPACMLALKIILVILLLYLEIMKYRPCNMKPIPLTDFLCGVNVKTTYGKVMEEGHAAWQVFVHFT